MRPLAYRLAALAVAALVAFPLVGSATSSLNPPSGTITSITPASGPTAGGTTITILGTDLYYGTSGPAVTIGGASAPVTSWRRWGAFGETEIIATTPPGAAGAADVRVVTADPSYNDRLLALSQGGFTYVAPAPTITATAVSPTSGLTTGGEVVTITGTGFSGATAPTVTFTGADGTTADGTAVTVASDTSLTVTTPPLAKGKAGISVTQGGATAVLAGAYTYNQGYWLTVTTKGPNDIGTLGSLGAVRTPSFGDWATRSSPFTSYSGGINCGDRTKVQKWGPKDPSTIISWAGGPCRYAFPEDTSVKLAALSTGSSTLDFPVADGDFTVGGRSKDFAPYRITEYGFVRRWFDACLGVTGSNCTVKMTGDRVVGAAWAYFKFVQPTAAEGVTTVRDGELYLSLLAAEKPVGVDTTYFVGAGFSTESGTENGARARPQQVVACRAKARLSGRRLTARCAPNQALTRALRKGSVRMTTRWYVRLPNQRAARLIATRTQMVRSPRPGAVTG